MNEPMLPSTPINIGEAFGYVFHSRNWVGRLAICALCVLFFWVFLIPVFILTGYFIETARRISRGERELPPWDHVGQKLGEGFMLSVALFVWGLPGTILSSAGGGVQRAGSFYSYTPNALAPLGALYALLVALLTAAIWSQFLDGGFVAAFDFKAVFRRAMLQPGMTVLVWLMVIVAGIIGFLGVIVVGIGLLFTIPYASAISAHLYAQFRQRTQVATIPAHIFDTDYHQQGLT